MMRGDTLIEVLIALTIAVLVVSAITVLGITSLNNAKFVTTQDQATKYTQEGLEIVRKIRNSNYVAYASYSGVYCLAKNALSLVGGPCTTANIDNIYIRSVEIQQNVIDCGTNLAYTTVTVSWTDGKCETGTFCHSTKLSSCLSTLPPIPGP